MHGELKLYKHKLFSSLRNPWKIFSWNFIFSTIQEKNIDNRFGQTKKTNRKHQLHKYILQWKEDIIHHGFTAP